jgi:hypothetical protein
MTLEAQGGRYKIQEQADFTQNLYERIFLYNTKTKPKNTICHLTKNVDLKLI